MDNMFGAKMGQIFISMKERNESAIGRLKFQEELERPIPKPILPAPPKQLLDVKKIKTTLTPEQAKRVQLEKNLKDYIAYKPPKFNKEEILQSLMIKELVNKQLERNKKLREQVKKGQLSPADYEKNRVQDHVLLGQVRSVMTQVSEPLISLGVDMDRLEEYLENPTGGPSTNPGDESTAEIVARDVADTVDRLLDAQETRIAETAPLVSSGPKTAQSPATNLLMEQIARGEIPNLNREALLGLSKEELEAIAGSRKKGKPPATVRDARQILEERTQEAARKAGEDMRALEETRERLERGEIERVPRRIRRSEEQREKKSLKQTMAKARADEMQRLRRELGK